ncbi:hypothetical protein [Falsirhodobacter halotolerans]|uniref:hypothetical protein n=1 Tax=Falsirhodobacter halotolerans TaxID=1146892 RepID=UPI001FCFAAF7|nr:hypothetical protein [Falsirhodobacter halotolerans]MCJ8139332.1 hypothetical protein [Falsirhodobacter halotolerans]
MSEEPHISATVKRRNAFEETHRASRSIIDAEQSARDEKTARLRKLREEATKGAKG